MLDNGGPIDYGRLIDDRPDDGVFQVERRIYRDPAILEDEFERIFERGWVFLCLEGLLRQPGDYMATHIGREPVFVMRQDDGSLGAFINACSHRGALLTPRRAGHMETITCPYHDWCFDKSGKCTAVKGRQIGWPGDDFDLSPFNLRPIARLESYRGFVFGSLNPDVPPLTAHLGPITTFLDLYCAPAPHELEVVAGACVHTANCNWKVLHDNGPDGYHASTVHRNFMRTMAHRDQLRGSEGVTKTEAGRLKGSVRSGSFAAGNGHTAFWADKETPESFPVWAMKEELEGRLSPEHAEWVLRKSRHVTIFPNLLVNELASTYIRTYRPLSVDRTEISSWCLAPVGEAAALRAARLRKFEDFFMPTGMSTPDDVAIFELTHQGNCARLGHRSEVTRGASTAVAGANEAARELGITPDQSSDHFTHDIMLQGIYRQWRSMMTAADAGDRPGA